MSLQKLLFTTCVMLLGLVAQSKLSDSTQVNALLDESSKLFGQDNAKAIDLAEKAKDLAIKIKYKRGEAYALKNIGIVHHIQGNAVEVLMNWNKSLHIFEEINDKKGIANLLSNIGALYNNRSDNVTALDYFLRGLKIAEENNDVERLNILYNNIGNVYQIRKDYNQALSYYLKAIKVVEKMENPQTELLGAMYVNVGTIYTVMENHDFEKANQYLNKALIVYGSSGNIVNAYNSLGELYVAQKRYKQAYNLFQKAIDKAEENEDKLATIQALKGLGRTHVLMNDLNSGISYYERAENLAALTNIPAELSEIYQHMSSAYAEKKDYKSAFKYQNLYTTAQDSLYKTETNLKLGNMQFDFELDKKEDEIALLTKDKALQEADLKRQRFAKNAFMVGLILIFVITYVIFRNYRNKVKVNRVLDRQKVQIEQLLLNILPAEVANELQTTGRATPRNYDHVSVLFTDFKGFTLIADKLSPEQLVHELNACFEAFDDIMIKNGIEKIKTVGDSYMCAGGIPVPDKQHPFRIVKAALEIKEYISKTNEIRKQLGQELWEVRIGIHVGPLTAGVVGKKKYAYDIWGSTVNIASRMESSGVPGQINISAATYEIIKDKYNCVYRGKIYAKNVGEVDMYLIDAEKGETGKIITDVEKKIEPFIKKEDHHQKAGSTLLQ